MVGAISADGLSGLLSFTNIFNGIRCSFRPGSCVPATVSPLGRAVQQEQLTGWGIERNGTKGQYRASDPVLRRLRLQRDSTPAGSFRVERDHPDGTDGTGHLLAIQRDGTTIRLPGISPGTAQVGGTFG